MKRDATSTVAASQFGREAAEMVDALRYGDFSPALEECIGLARQSIGANFVTASSPTGNAWPTRKDPTLTHPLEILSGDLFQAETSDFAKGSIKEMNGREALIGVDSTEIPYAAAQNFGNPDRNLPARLSFDVSDAALDKMAEIVAERALELLM